MKLLALIIMGLLTWGNTLSAQMTEGNKKILVAYFSCTGTTEKVAEAIAETTGGKLYRITPAKAYTSADLDWQNKTSRSSVEMADDKSRPALGGEAIDPKDYDVIFIGYPIWWDLCPRPVNTFLEKYDFSGKTIMPFATSGGSSIANSVKQLKKLYPKVVWQDGKLLNGGAKQAGVLGVKIGYGSIVGAQSVVTHDVPPMTIVAGNPARTIKTIEINHE